MHLTVCNCYSCLVHWFQFNWCDCVKSSYFNEKAITSMRHNSTHKQAMTFNQMMYWLRIAHKTFFFTRTVFFSSRCCCCCWLWIFIISVLSNNTFTDLTIMDYTRIHKFGIESITNPCGRRKEKERKKLAHTHRHILHIDICLYTRTAIGIDCGDGHMSC